MSREQILDQIRRNKPGATELTEIDFAQFRSGVDVQERFIQNLLSVNGIVVHVEDYEELDAKLRGAFPEANNIICCGTGLKIGTVDPTSVGSAKELADLDLAVIQGQFGVAENGAVWVADQDFPHRSIPFIASHVAIVLKRSDIVENMHEACLRLSGFSEGYGVFVSGPSKTADIEQSLVIGAQGPLSLTVFLVGA